MKTLQKSRGIVSALVTPFTHAGELQLEAMRRLVQHALSLGVGGFYVCGSTGEGFSMSLNDRMRALETVVAEAGGRADVIANVSHMEYRELFRLCDHAADVGADAVSVLPPIYNPISREEMVNYFRAVLQQSRLPVTLYNIPQLAQRSLDEQSVRELSADPKLVGIKHTSEDTAALARFKQIDDGRLIVWSGRDAYYLGCLAMGADGAIGSTFQILGDLFAAITAAFRGGDFQRALQLQQRTNRVHARLQTHGPLKSIKRCLRLMGCDVGECRLPYDQLPTNVDGSLQEALSEAELIRAEFGLPSRATVN